jgi:protein-disulfide isomerase
MIQVSLAALFSAAVIATPSAAQQTSNDELKKDIEELRATLAEIQKDLQEIKGMLARPAAPPSGIGAVIDYGGGAIKGEPTAKVTLLEFSDYQ